MTISRQTLARLVIGALLLVGVSWAAGYWFAGRGDHSIVRESDSNTAPTSAAGQSRAPLYWYDPMVPNQHFDKPGKSPFMDMQLVPKYANESVEAGGVRVSANTVQNLGIRTGRVEKIVLPSQLRAVGAVAFDERLLELVQARVEGAIVSLSVKAPFERVRRGQPLAEVLAPQWLEAEQQYVALLNANTADSIALRDAARERLSVLGVPDTAIRSIESTHKASATTTVYAPIDGVVTDLPARQGAAFMSGTTLFRINGLKSVWVNAQIPEGEVSRAALGLHVEARATAWPGISFRGRLVALLPDVDPQTRTLTARVAIDNEAYRLSPGMYVTLDLANSQGAPQLVVPSEALIVTGTRSVVILARADRGFEVADVTVGRQQGGRTAILSGLHEGDLVVLSGQFLIDSEASLTATVNRLQSSATETAGHDAASPPESKP